MKIAHVITIYHSVITIIDSKLRALNSFDDLNVSVISSPPADNCGKSAAAKFIPISMSRSIKPWSDFISIVQLWRVFRREKFDIVHSHTAKAGFLTAVAAKMAGVPFVCHTYHGLPFFSGQNKRAYRAYRLLERIASLFRNHVFTQNRAERAKCVRLMGSENKVTYEGNGVDIEGVRESADQQLPLAGKDFPGGGLKLVLLSRLEAVKRVDDFIKVVDKLRRGGLEVSCVIAGAGPLEEQLRSYIGQMQLSDCVNIVGFSDHPHGLIAASDIVLLCSEKEGIPRAIMEAMALQKPVVATDVSGTKELVVDGQMGFLVPLGDTEAMAEKVALLAGDPSLRKKMGARGLGRINTKFNDIAITEMLHEFYVARANCVCGA